MSDESPTADRSDVRLANEALAERLGTKALTLHLEGSESLNPSCLRLTMGGGDLGAIEPLPGQDIMFYVPSGDSILRRRYSIRRFDRARASVQVDIALHGDGPGRRWATSLQAGETVEGIGPRGKISPDPAANWHMFIGDDSFAPAALNMAESLPKEKLAVVVLQVDGPDHRQNFSLAAGLEGPVWIWDEGAPPARAARLLEALSGVELPQGPGHAYVGGEHKVVAALREVLIDKGMQSEAISHKAYWRFGRENASNGEPERE
ncbi:MAG: siderophore-interacting protein [Acidimicrobiales bacterium]